jgi:hypothetical protein
METNCSELFPMHFSAHDMTYRPGTLLKSFENTQTAVLEQGNTLAQ